MIRPRSTNTSRRFAMWTLLFCALIGAVQMAPSAQAEPLVMPRAKLVDLLGQRYKERPTSMGLDSGGAVIEVFASPNGATWTMVRTIPNGLSLIIGTGEHWGTSKPQVTGKLL